MYESRDDRVTVIKIRDLPTANDSGVKSVRKAINILTLLGQNHDGMALGGIASALSMPKPSVHRFLTTLEDMKCVFYDAATKRWAIDARAFAICSPTRKHHQLAALLNPHLHCVAEKSGETANLYVRRQWQVQCLAQVKTDAPGRAMGPPGTSFPLHCSAAGKAILAGQPHQLVEDYIAMHGLYSLTRKTITSSVAFRRDLCWTRSRGYATDFDEHEIGLRCIAVPIRDKNGDAVAALSISGSSLRMKLSKVEGLRQLFLSIAPGLPEIDFT